ncbi:FGGY family carbohydrate kinase [Escherichia coli]
MLEARVPQSRVITGNLMMPGFTAPKLLWVQRHEPEIFRQIDKVLLPKDYLRLRMTGSLPAICLTQLAPCGWMSQKRDWSDVMLQACDLSRDQMPALYEGSEITGALLPEVAKAWGMATVPVVAGGGDNAAGAVGVGMVDANQAMLSLGTSGVYFAVSEGFLSKPESAVHSFLPCATATLAFNVCDAECSVVSGLGREINRPEQCPSFNRCSSTG